MFVMPPALGLPVLTAFALLCGSLPFSLWVGRWLAGRDVREAGDHNPGATNALRVGGWRIGLVAFMLDISKGALPVGLAQYVFAYSGLPLLLVALAPLVGSAFSPFLNFRGGKSLSVSLGIWIGLTLWRVPFVASVALVGAYITMDNPGLAVLTALLAMGAYLVLLQPDGVLLAVWGVMCVVLLAKHRADFARKVELRGWVKRLLLR